MDSDIPNRLHAAAELGVIRDVERKLRKDGKGPGPGTALYVRGCDPCIFWVGLTWHVDDPTMLFCVAADDAPYTGPADVSVEASEAFAPMTLRCGHALWFSAPVLERCTVAGVVGPVAVERALDVVEQVLRGRVPTYAVEESLEDWYDVLEDACDELRVIRDESEAEALSIDTSLPARRGATRTRVPAVELAAAASDASEEWAPLEFAVGEARFQLQHGRGDRAARTVSFRCAQIDGGRFPVLMFSLCLVLRDGRVLPTQPRTVHDGDEVVIHDLGGRDEVIAVDAFPED